MGHGARSVSTSTRRDRGEVLRVLAPNPSLNETEPAAPRTDAEHFVDKKLVSRVASWSLSLAMQAHRASTGAFL